MGSARRGIGAVQALLLVVGSLACGAGALEVGLRLLWGGYYERFDPERPFGEFDFHPTRKLTPAPNLEHLDWNREFQVWHRHNALGLRGPEIVVDKSPSRTRVLAVGDSMTYGIGVEYDETYSAVIEALDPRLQVINAGVPAYSGAQELLLLREHIGPLAPDVVIVAYFWNDLFESYRDAYPRVELRDGRPRFVPPVPASPQHPAFERLRRRHERRAHHYGSFSLGASSYLYRFLSDRIKVLRYALRELRGERSEVVGGGALSPKEEDAAWQLSYALLRAQRDLAREHGAHFAVLVVPDQVQVEPDVTVYGVPPALHRVQQRVVSFANSEGIPVIDPLERLREIRLGEGEPQYHRLDRHWNRVGHRHMARVLLEELRRLGMIPREPAMRAARGPGSGP